MDLFEIEQIITSILISGGIVYGTVTLLKSVAIKFDLYEKPDGDRKLHSRIKSEDG